MIERLKKIGIVLTIAVLLTVFIFSLTNAIHPEPKYEDFCQELARPVKLTVDNCAEVETPTDCKGRIDYQYGSDGCPTEASCNMCYDGFDKANEKYRLVLFIVASVAGVLANLFGIFYRKKDPFWMLVRSGAIIGGLASLFIGTGIYYSDLGRYVRPIVILAELLLVILVAWWAINKRK